MHRCVGTVCLTLATAPCLFAQIPNVQVKFDGLLFLRDGKGSSPRFKAYDLWGKHSVITIELNIEPGFDLVLSQRFQPIEGDSDSRLVDELTISDRGYWRVGKLYGVFGAGKVYRESALGAEFNLTVGSKATPFVLTLLDEKAGRQRGVLARLGSKLGVSLAVGEHFASNGSALTVIRRPEDGPGRDRGYKFMAAVDYQARVVGGRLILEQVLLRDGERESDNNLDVSHVEYGRPIGTKWNVVASFSQEWQSQSTFLALGLSFNVYPSVFLEPIVRIKNGELYDWGFGLRVKP